MSVQGDGRVQVAARNAGDGDLQLATQSAKDSNVFGDWQDVGGFGIDQPVTGTLPDGKLVAFGIVGGKLWHLPQDGRAPAKSSSDAEQCQWSAAISGVVTVGGGDVGDTGGA